MAEQTLAQTKPKSKSDGGEQHSRSAPSLPPGPRKRGRPVGSTKRASFLRSMVEGAGGSVPVVQGDAISAGESVSSPLEFDHWRRRQEWQRREQLITTRENVRTSFSDWLEKLYSWQFSVDFTFRTGTAECSRQSLSPQDAVRALSDGERRVAGYAGLPVVVFAAPERQSRGTLHWHTLWHFKSEEAPYIPARRWLDLWQAPWKLARTWREHNAGIEGRIFVRFLNAENTGDRVRYVCKYVTKEGCDDGPLFLESDITAGGSLIEWRRFVLGQPDEDVHKFIKVNDCLVHRRDKYDGPLAERRLDSPGVHTLKMEQGTLWSAESLPGSALGRCGSLTTESGFLSVWRALNRGRSTVGSTTTTESSGPRAMPPPPPPRGG